VTGASPFLIGLATFDSPERQGAKDRMVVAMGTSRAWERYAWVAGIVFVVALVAESVVATGVGLTQNDSAAKIANGLYEHRERLLVIAYFSIVYAAGFLIYLGSLYKLLREACVVWVPARSRHLLHAVSGDVCARQRRRSLRQSLCPCSGSAGDQERRPAALARVGIDAERALRSLSLNNPSPFTTNPTSASPALLG